MFHTHTTLSHTTLSHIIFHTHPFHIQLCHIQLCHTQLCHTPSTIFLTPSLSHTIYIHLDFAWQAWHLVTSTFVSRGRRGTYGTGLGLVAALGAVAPWRHPPSFCVAGVVLMALWHTQLLRTPSFAQLCYTPSFTHNSHTQLCHTPSFTHNFYTQLCHTPSFSHTIFHTHNYVTRNFVTHTHTNLRIQVFQWSSSTTSFLYPSFPIPLELLFLLIGRNWIVGLSGPLIDCFQYSLPFGCMCLLMDGT